MFSHSLGRESRFEHEHVETEFESGLIFLKFSFESFCLINSMKQQSVKY